MRTALPALGLRAVLVVAARRGRRLPAALALAGVLALVAGCAGTPFDGKLPSDLDRKITPREAATQPERVHDQPVMWGGSIVSVRNLPDRTEVAVLAYPLDDNGMPQVEEQADGRFIVRQRGFLDPAIYTSGRLLTVLGQLSGTIHGKVAAAPYTFPVVEAKDLHLWRSLRPSNTHFMLGIGLGFGL